MGVCDDDGLMYELGYGNDIGWTHENVAAWILLDDVLAWADGKVK